MWIISVEWGIQGQRMRRPLFNLFFLFFSELTSKGNSNILWYASHPFKRNVSSSSTYTKWCRTTSAIPGSILRSQLSNNETVWIWSHASKFILDAFTVSLRYVQWVTKRNQLLQYLSWCQISTKRDIYWKCFALSFVKEMESSFFCSSLVLFPSYWILEEF